MEQESIILECCFKFPLCVMMCHRHAALGFEHFDLRFKSIDLHEATANEDHCSPYSFPK